MAGVYPANHRIIRISRTRREKYMVEKKLIWFLVLPLIGLFGICKGNGENNSLKYFKVPSQITIYQKGASTEWSVSSPQSQELVCRLHDRIKEPLLEAKLAVTAPDIAAMLQNEMVVVFQYSSLQSTDYKVSNQIKTLKYTRLLFSLTGNYRELMFFGNESGYFSGPLGLLADPDSVVTLITH